MGLSRQEYWSGLPCPPPGDLPDPGIEPRSPALQADSLPSEPAGKPMNTRVGSLSFLQEIFLTQESNWGLLHCRWILHWLSYPGSPFYYLSHFKIKKKKRKKERKKPQWLKPNKQTNTVLDKNDKLVKITERVLQTLSIYFSKPFVN